jgi:outer membrane protein OmpA-like peptidoglycan-associated protein
LAAIALLLMPAASHAKSSYFGVPNRALAYPDDFDQTDVAIAKAEQSPGAQVCPEKIAKARELAREGVLTYWACHTKEGLALLAQARQLAKEAESCVAAPKPVAAPPAPPAPKEVVVLKGINFAFNSNELTPDSKKILDQWVAKLKGEPNIRVEVAGYTDSVGSDAYNQKLSERRAQAVVDYFVSQGVASDRLKAAGYGKTNPIASNKTDAGRAQNRRVELHIF